MPRDRYLLILKFLHFADNSSVNKDDRLFKIRRIVDHFRSTSKNSLYPFQNIVIDEGLLLFEQLFGIYPVKETPAWGEVSCNGRLWNGVHPWFYYLYRRKYENKGSRRKCWNIRKQSWRWRNHIGVTGIACSRTTGTLAHFYMNSFFIKNQLLWNGKT